MEFFYNGKPFVGLQADYHFVHTFVKSSIDSLPNRS